jgi:NAD(P)-dependent dehydrogenase (short-subunit alcohol dehydrogenase family)
MEVNYFGLLRLAQSFAPALRARAADGAVAWVNLLSIFALANFPPHGTFSASQAAAHSLAQCLRAETRGAGLRVVNVYPGPVEQPVGWAKRRRRVPTRCGTLVRPRGQNRPWRCASLAIGRRRFCPPYVLRHAAAPA